MWEIFYFTETYLLQAYRIKVQTMSENFKTSIKLASHVAKEHHKEEEAWDIEFQST